jgi:nicotinate-nucleotide pyrophosphorylase (carboxylating)
MKALEDIIELALEEDIGPGDITTESLFQEGVPGRANIIAKEDIIVCGQEVAQYVFEKVDIGLSYEIHIEDRNKAKAGETIGKIKGSLRSIFAAERVALNFLQHLSGISTLVSQFVEMVRDYKVELRDTRKTTPGYRELEKYAVHVGGGKNHRRGLYDAVMIKSNHVDSFHGSISDAIIMCRKLLPSSIQIEVEVRNEEELKDAISSRPDAVLLDNLTPSEVARLIKLAKSEFYAHSVFFEYSGGVNKSNIIEYAKTGVNAISVGMFTHSVQAVDIALRVVNTKQ